MFGDLCQCQALNWLSASFTGLPTPQNKYSYRRNYCLLPHTDYESRELKVSAQLEMIQPLS